MKKLSELAKNFKTDKGIGLHEYTEVYDVYLDPIKDEKMNFLEIGVFEGESLKLWEEYLKNSNILGLDINSDCAKYAGGRKKVYIGSQIDEVLLWKIEKENHPLSVIIDDGSHNWDHQIKTFKAAFPLLKAGGLYFIEDLHTSYTGKWAGGDTTGVEFLKGLVDDVMLRGKSFMGTQEVGNQSLSYFEHHMEYIHFYKSLCVVKKRETAL
jgi:hypothetical protein